MIAITWGTKNEGAGQGPRNMAKLLLVQISSKTQASQLKMCIYTDLQKALEDKSSSAGILA